jgi:putative glutamine amidotransferase
VSEGPTTGSPPDERPVRIGLSACFFHADPERKIFTGKTLLYVEESMAHWVAGGGALVYPVPTVPDGAAPGLVELVEDLDGLVLHGGADVSPTSYGEEALKPEWAGDAVRDRYEIDLVSRFIDAGKPILGICRGIQVLNVALGGTLYQDLVEQEATQRVHRDAVAYDRNEHELVVDPDTRLASLVGAGAHRVNSVHHQGIKELAPGLVAEARSADDGVIEAVRLDGGEAGPWCSAVQWHPEFRRPTDAHLLDDTPLRAAFVAACRARRQGSVPCAS